jgi:replicative DNA helicase
MITGREAIEAFDVWSGAPCDRQSTGFALVDEVTGGFRRGQVWIVTGTPGQGRSTLATQWALRLGTQFDMHTKLVSNREPVHLLVTRMLANAGEIPVSHLWNDELTDRDTVRVAEARKMIANARLRIYGPGQGTFLAAGLEESTRPEGLVVDDADMELGASPEHVGAIAAMGVLVILTLPHAMVISSRGIDPRWARVTDFVLQLNRPDLLEPRSPRSGEADIEIVRNRWGPQLSTTIAFQGHYARFVELSR